MKISIITVCFNSAHTIRDTIESVFSQSYNNIEYLIIDGGSTDGTLDVIDQYRNDGIACVISEPDRGMYDAMNKGIKMATGDAIGILNSDDLFEDDDVIRDVVATFSNADSDMVVGDVVWVDRNDLSRVRRYYSSKKFRVWKLRTGWMPPHPATFIRRSVYDRAGLYSLNYRIAADYEMFVRLLLVHGCSFSRVNRVLVRMRLGGISTGGISNSWLLNREIVRACRSNGIYTNLFLVLSKMPFKLLELYMKPQKQQN